MTMAGSGAFRRRPGLWFISVTYLKMGSEKAPRCYELRDTPPQAYASAKFHLRASLVRINIPASRDRPRGGGDRSDICGFSAQSHKRMMLLLNTIVRDCPLPLFVTLTYPGVWTPDPREWKRHLHNFGEWLRAKFPRASYVWKLEPQERGAPHFHLMIWGIRFVPWQVIAVRWCEIVSDLDFKAPRTWSTGKSGCAEFRAFSESVEIKHGGAIADHLRAGAQTRQVESRNGVKAYAGKNYMGKHFEGMEGVGRFWGVHNRKALPRPRAVRRSMPVEAVVTFARIARKWLAKQGYRRKHTTSMDLFTSDPLRWKKLLHAICQGKMGPRERVRTRAQVERLDRQGRRSAQALAALASPVKSAFIWD